MGAGVVFLHMLSADAADRENVRVVGVLHVVDVTDVDAFAHLAKLRRLAKILDVDAMPAAMRHAWLRPFPVFGVSAFVEHTVPSRQDMGTRGGYVQGPCLVVALGLHVFVKNYR